MNTNVEFTLYTRPTNVGLPIKTSHVFVVSSDGHNWNCFGHGSPDLGDNQSQPILKVGASSKWATAIYGLTSEGDQGAKPAAGMRLNFDGVCHTAANRVLVLAGDNIDTRKTDGDALAILMYGKFGFNLDQYIPLVESTGNALLQSDPNEITKEDISTVLNRINQRLTATCELDILHLDAQEQINTIHPGTILPDITAAQRTAFCPIYTEYQNERAAVFKTTAASVPPGTQIAFGALRTNLAAPWRKCSASLVAAIGLDGFQGIFGVTPNEVQSIFA